MEDKDVEFGLVAVFLIIACIVGTVLAGNRGPLHDQHCIAVCDAVAMDVLVSRDSSCVCGGSGPVREIPFDAQPYPYSRGDAGRDAGPDSGP